MFSHLTHHQSWWDAIHISQIIEEISKSVYIATLESRRATVGMIGSVITTDSSFRNCILNFLAKNIFNLVYRRTSISIFSTVLALEQTFVVPRKSHNFIRTAFFRPLSVTTTIVYSFSLKLGTSHAPKLPLMIAVEHHSHFKANGSWTLPYKVTHWVSNFLTSILVTYEHLEIKQ